MTEFATKFRNAQNLLLTKGLFWEFNEGDKSQCLFTIKERTFKGLPSLYKLYMEADDPSEYSFAIEHLEGWTHWERLCKCEWFVPYVEAWRRELQLRVRSQALMNLREEAGDPDNKGALQANKFLLEKNWGVEHLTTGRDPKVGRPSKEAIKNEAKRLVETKQDIQSDADRILQ